MPRKEEYVPTFAIAISVSHAADHYVAVGQAVRGMGIANPSLVKYVIRLHGLVTNKDHLSNSDQAHYVR